MIIPIKIMNKTIIKHNNFIECFFKIKNQKSGTNTKVQGLISIFLKSVGSNDIFKLKS